MSNALLSQPVLELRFPVGGKQFPTDHGWPLYGAISRLCPDLHAHPNVQIGAIEGAAHMGKGGLRLHRKSFLPIRLPADLVSQAYALAGQTLEVKGQAITLGIPNTRMLTPSEDLFARIVIISNRPDWISFQVELMRQLMELGVTADITPGKRRVMRVKGFVNIGFAVGLGGLTPEMSLKVLSHGLGGRRSMGAGFFQCGQLAPSAVASPEDLMPREVSH